MRPVRTGVVRAAFGVRPSPGCVRPSLGSSGLCAGAGAHVSASSRGERGDTPRVLVPAGPRRLPQGHERLKARDCVAKGPFGSRPRARPSVASGARASRLAASSVQAARSRMTLIRPIVLNGPAEPTASPTEPARAVSMRYRHLTDLRGRCARGGLWAAVTASMVFAVSADLAAQSYHLSSPAPASQHIRISNSTGDTATFALKLNGRGYRDIDDVLAEIASSADDYPGEPEYRKAWRFIRGRIRHASPLEDFPGGMIQPARPRAAALKETRSWPEMRSQSPSSWSR